MNSIATSIGGHVSSVISYFDSSSLSPELKTQLSNLENWDFSNVRSRLERKTDLYSSDTEIDQAIDEFKKFVALVIIYGSGLEMTSERVDEVWHQLILFSKDYFKFSRDVVGVDYMHHNPNTGTFNKAKAQAKQRHFLDLYRSVFGEVPAIWNKRSGEKSAGCCDDDDGNCCDCTIDNDRNA